MQSFPNIIIIRHKRENIKKCSLKGLESRKDFVFYQYPPKINIPINPKCLLLSIHAQPLTTADKDREILVLDGTWRYASAMKKYLDTKSIPLEERSIPKGWRTAYPRRQEDCEDPSSGLASIEAIAIAFLITGRDPSGLLDHYHWKKEFKEINENLGNQFEGWKLL